jgi:hypothetical protein
LIQDAGFPQTEAGPVQSKLLEERQTIDIEALKRAPPIVADVIDFARTLGAYAPGIDPVAFGLLRATSSLPISPMFAAKHALLENKRWFLSVTVGEELPWLEVDFGDDANVTVQSVALRTEVRCPDDGEVAVPERLQLVGWRSRWKTLVAELDLKERLVESRKTAILAKPAPEGKGAPKIVERIAISGLWEVGCRPGMAVCNRVRIVQKEPHPSAEGEEFAYRSNVLRLHQVTFVGRFGLKQSKRLRVV